MLAKQVLPERLAELASCDPRQSIDVAGIAMWVAGGTPPPGILGEEVLQGLMSLLTDKMSLAAEEYAFCMGETVLRLGGTLRALDDSPTLCMARRSFGALRNPARLDVFIAISEAMAVTCNHAWDPEGLAQANHDLSLLGSGRLRLRPGAAERLEQATVSIIDLVRAKLAVLFVETVCVPLVAGADSPSRIWSDAELYHAVTQFDELVRNSFEIPGYDRNYTRSNRNMLLEENSGFDDAEDWVKAALRGPSAGKA